MEEKPMMRLMVAESEVEANLLKGVLMENGIHVLVSGLDGSALGSALDGPDEIMIFVYEEDLQNSRDLVSEIIEADEDPVPAWTCKCGEDVDEGFFVCWSCGAEFEQPA